MSQRHFCNDFVIKNMLKMAFMLPFTTQFKIFKNEFAFLYVQCKQEF